MKTIAKRVTAMLLIMLMFCISPLNSAAPASHAAGNATSGEVAGTSDGQETTDGESEVSDEQDADSGDAAGDEEKSKDAEKADKEESDKEKSDDADDNGVYISEVRIGMGETEAEAKKELEAEGFTILKDDSGNNADLNVDAGSKSALKRGANDKIVYLGYKTTTDINDAITDLAVMNMKGGFSIEDYNILMETEMESRIKPFVESFIRYGVYSHPEIHG